MLHLLEQLLQDHSGLLPLTLDRPLAEVDCGGETEQGDEYWEPRAPEEPVEDLEHGTHPGKG